MKVTLSFALFLVLAAPGAALAAGATVVGRDVSRGVNAPPARFNLVGLHWKGSGAVSFRTRSVSGRWSGWRDAAPENDAPDARTHELRKRGWQLGSPYWTGPSNRIQVRALGRIGRVRAYYVWSPLQARSVRAVAVAGSPLIASRAGWGANERIRRGRPRYADSVRFAVVHHTAGSNSYTRAQSAAIVRGIQRYHVLANGWDDIGYNFLVDRYGQVFEGRYGGVERNVVGAHAQGFNTGSTGVALIGTHEGAAITPAARSALTRLLAWRLDVAHVDPLTTFTWRSAGNPRFPAGRNLTLRTISGHRDTGYTTCPGSRLFGELPALARSVSQTGWSQAVLPCGDRRPRSARALHRDAQRAAPLVGGCVRARWQRDRDGAGDRHRGGLDVGRHDDSGGSLPLRDRCRPHGPACDGCRRRRVHAGGPHRSRATRR